MLFGHWGRISQGGGEGRLWRDRLRREIRGEGEVVAWTGTDVGRRVGKGERGGCRERS